MMFNLNIIEKLESLMEPFKNWVFKNYGNPLLWFGLFALGALIFGVIYQKLQKEK